MSYQLIRGDALALPLADESVDACVTSPPYFALRSYTDGGEHYDGQIGSEATPQAFLEALWAVTAECRRVLKPGGSIFVNLGDKYSGAQAQNVGPSAKSTLAGNGHKGGGPKAHAVRSLDSAAMWQRTNPRHTGIPAKSLMGLPWRYALGCIDQLGLILRAEVIWAKPNGLPESVTDRVRRSHEQWFHFTKEPRYFSAVDEVREESRPPTGTALRFAEVGGTSGFKSNGNRGDEGRGNFVPSPLGKLPGSVWTVPTEPLRVPDHLGVDHFAAFPSEFPRRIILGWSPSGVCVACGEGRRPVVAKERVGVTQRSEATTQLRGGGSGGGYALPGADTWQATEATITGYACACPDTTAPTRPAVVLDPFCGTGTTPAVAHALGRHGIGIDLSADYLRLAEWRCNDPGLRAKVLGVDKPKPQIDGQASLFGDAA